MIADAFILLMIVVACAAPIIIITAILEATIWRDDDG